MVDTNKQTKSGGRAIVSQRRRQACMTVLLGCTILFSGMGIGFGGALAYLGESKAAAVSVDDPLPTKAAITITRNIASKVGLDDQQRGKVKSLMLKRLKALKAIRTKAMDEMLVVHRAISEDMREVLEPGQFKDWEKRFNAARKRSKFRHRPWKPRGKHGGRGGRDGPGKPRGGMSEMFKRLDVDDNGELTAGELKKAHPQLRQFIEKADTNADGKIDRKEFETQLHQRRPPSGSPWIRKPHDRPGPKPTSAPETDLSMLWG